MTQPLYLDRPEGRIAYDDQGQGPLVVLVPGLGDLRQEYRLLAPRLVTAGYRVVTMDLRGLGQSSVGFGDYRSSAIGSDVVALVRALDAGPAAIIGTSMGAAAAAWAAAEAPELVDRLVLVGPFVRNEMQGSALKLAAMKVVMRVAFNGPWAPKAWAAYMDTLYPARKPADWPAYRASLIDMLREPGRMAAMRAMMFASKADVAVRLPEVKAPTLVVMGSKDPDFEDPAKEADTVARLLRGEVVMIEGAGHYPHAEMPDDTTPAILGFLTRNAAA